MKRQACLLATSLLLVFSSAASANYELPGITESEATDEVTRFLSEKFPGWRYKRAGFVDCRHGRINNFTWSCAIGWVSGRANCWHGRARATNEFVEDGTLYYTVKANVSRWC